MKSAATALVLVLAMPLLVSSEYSTTGNCILAPYGDSQGGSEANIKLVTGMKEMAVVVVDPSDDEKDFSCMRVILDAKNSVFSLKYVDESGVQQNYNGSMTVERIPGVLGVGEKVYYEMPSLASTDLLNGGELHTIYVGGGVAMFKTCKNSVLKYYTTTYLMTSISKAKNYEACNCDAW